MNKLHISWYPLAAVPSKYLTTSHCLSPEPDRSILFAEYEIGASYNYNIGMPNMENDGTVEK